MATYIVEAAEKENKTTENKHSILTQNRLQTIEKREVSLEALKEKHARDNSNSNIYLYSLETKEEESKNKILCPKISITKKDLENPFIAQIEETIQTIKLRISKPDYEFPKDVCKWKAILIDLKKDQYFIKSCINPSINFNKIGFSKKGAINYYSKTGYWIEDKYVEINDSTFYFHKPKHMAALLNNFSSLKTYCEKDIQSTIYWILIDFENLVEKIEDKKYKDILYCKMSGKTNDEIEEFLLNKYNESYSVTYISSLINKVLPKLLCKKYNELTMDWLYTYKLNGIWKTCTKCGQTKIANRSNFSLNKRGKYGLHSVCKKCRSKGSEK